MDSEATTQTATSAKETSYGQIVRSTGIFGGSQAVNMIVGMLRTKAVALLVGTTGVGLIGLYQSVISMVQSLSSLGLSFSAVRDISQAASNEDAQAISSTATTVRRWMMFTAIAGALLTIAFAPALSNWAFHDKAHIVPISCLSFAVFMATLSAGQSTLLQGLRRIGDMARASVYGSVFSLVGFTLLFWLFGIDGIVPALLAASFITLICSTFYVCKIKLPKVQQSYHDTFFNGKKMVMLGIYSMIAGLVGTLSMFILKGYLSNRADIETVGLFQSAWSLSSAAIASILTAMSTDYYPRLCQVSHDDGLLRSRVKEQTRVCVILSSVVVSAMLLFAPFLLNFFYSAKFVPAEPLLRWQVLGTLVKTLSWPLAFVVLSKGKGLLFCLTEVLWYALYLGACFILWPLMGLEGLGIAYLIAHVLYTLSMLWLIHGLCSYVPDRNNIRIEARFILLNVAAFVVAVFVENPVLNLVLSGSLLLLVTVYALYEFNRVWSVATAWNKLKNKLKRHE